MTSHVTMTSHPAAAAQCIGTEVRCAAPRILSSPVRGQTMPVNVPYL